MAIFGLITIFTAVLVSVMLFNYKHEARNVRFRISMQLAFTAMLVIASWLVHNDILNLIINLTIIVSALDLLKFFVNFGKAHR